MMPVAVPPGLCPDVWAVLLTLALAAMVGVFNCGRKTPTDVKTSDPIQRPLPGTPSAPVAAGAPPQGPPPPPPPPAPSSGGPGQPGAATVPGATSAAPSAPLDKSKGVKPVSASKDQASAETAVKPKEADGESNDSNAKESEPKKKRKASEKEKELPKTSIVKTAACDKEREEKIKQGIIVRRQSDYPDLADVLSDLDEPDKKGSSKPSHKQSEGNRKKSMYNNKTQKTQANSPAVEKV